MPSNGENNSNNKIRIFLDNLGLNQREQDIFLAALRYPRSSSSTLAKCTNIPRTTIHDIMQRLIKEGICIQHNEKKGTQYSAQTHDGLQSLLLNKKQHIDNDIRNLQELHKEFTSIETGDVDFSHQNRYHGINGLKKMYKKMAGSKFLRSINNIEASLSAGHLDIEDHIHFICNTIGSSREILVPSDNADIYNQSIGFNLEHHIRFLRTADANNMLSSQFITDTSFFYISYDKDIVGIEIQQDDFVHSQSILFDIMRASL